MHCATTLEYIKISRENMTVYIRVYVSMEFIVYSRHNNIPDMCKYTLSLDKYTQSTKNTL